MGNKQATATSPRSLKKHASFFSRLKSSLSKQNIGDNGDDGVEKMEIDGVTNEPCSPTVVDGVDMTFLKAILRIQRLARNRNAWKMVQEEHQWKIFHELDSRDECDMLSLAFFMQTLVDSVPNSESWKEKLEGLDDTDTEVPVNIDSIQLLSRGISRKIYFKPSEEYNLPTGEITSGEVNDIMEVYRTGGKISIDSVQKILRIIYKAFLELPNITYVTVSDTEKLNVVGDIHGQIADLLHILDEAGLPAPTNKFIFNGDFVDRGDKGVEVILLVFALYIAFPGCVVLNRGNHEDHAISVVYGFQKECKEKYDQLTFGMFAEVFRYMPLFSIVNNAIFVIHGGLFHRDNVTLQDLSEIQRSDYTPKPKVPYPANCQNLDAAGRRKEELKQLQREALWSDPEDSDGRKLSARGTGVVFGPDVTRNFLVTNGLRMVVRSHECVRAGFLLPFSGENATLLCTIFSASNYCGGNNDGAYMVFTAHAITYASAVPDTGLWFYVRQYKTSEASAALEVTNITSLRGLILKKRSALYQAFLAADTENCGLIPKSVWSDIMARVTDIRIRWLITLPAMCCEDVISSGRVAYNTFLKGFSLNSAKDVDIMDSLYSQRSKLEAIFNYFDSDGNGSISRAEFLQGCEVLNKVLPEEQQLADCDHILDLMDFDRSDSIDLNEFFEVFRILDAQDGQIDGIISMAGGTKHSSPGRPDHPGL